MKRNLVIALVLLAAGLYSQTKIDFTGVKLYVNKNTKEGTKPLENTEVEVLIDDTLVFKTKTDENGLIGEYALKAGKHKIKINCQSCYTQEMMGITVSERHKAWVVFLLTCESYLKSLTKRERKKLGYK